MRSNEVYSIYQKIYIIFNSKWSLSDWLWFCHLLSVYSHKISIFNCMDMYLHIVKEGEDETMNFEDYFRCCGELSEILYPNKGSTLHKLELLFRRYINMDSSLQFSVKKSVEAHRSISPLQHMLKCSLKLKLYENILKILYYHSLNFEYSISNENYIKQNKIYPTWNDILKIMNEIILIPKLSNNKYILESIQYHDGIIIKSLNKVFLSIYLNRMKNHKKYLSLHLLKEF